MDVDRLQVVLLGLGPVPNSERSGFSIRLGLPLAFASWRSRARPHAQERQHVAAAAASPPIGVVLSPDSIGISARTSSFFASRMASPSRGDGGLGAVIATLVLPGSVYVTHARLDLLEQLGFRGATGRWPSSSGSPKQPAISADALDLGDGRWTAHAADREQKPLRSRGVSLRNPVRYCCTPGVRPLWTCRPAKAAAGPAAVTWTGVLNALRPGLRLWEPRLTAL